MSAKRKRSMRLDVNQAELDRDDLVLEQFGDIRRIVRIPLNASTAEYLIDHLGRYLRRERDRYLMTIEAIREEMKK